ncbi:hypothetical protein E4K67_22315 [Desulfosporosinus fructosivorans]|uniref:Uncharacterized protein n=1 Tax=Desulfosporosinus fructosivorans TaxID=2018669 RepID=A0A4Z0R0I5_9FIRM|nr:hypothetical protein [Desulfosporosinus fructosivorans]TGE35855.1 hypothetical protein E4K67_22315 [Desulfosporosinus fructosivorans]
MMDLKIVSCKLNANLNLGSISEKRLVLLDELLMAKYSQKQMIALGIYAYINPVKKSAIVVGSGQININIDSEDILKNLSGSIPEYIELYNAITNAFTIDNIVDSIEIDFGGLVDSLEKGKRAAAIKSSQKFTTLNKKAFETMFPNLVGVGLRFIDDNDKFLLDAKIEPFLGDLSKFYLGFNVKSKQKMSTKELEEVILAQITKFEIFFGFAKDNFLI